MVCFIRCAYSLSSQLATLQRNLTSAKDELASTLRIKNSDRASFERKESSLKTEITKLKEDIEKQRKSASETRTEQRTVRSVSLSSLPLLSPFSVADDPFRFALQDLARSQAKVSGLESDVISLQRKTASLQEELARSGREKASFEGERNALKEVGRVPSSHLVFRNHHADPLLFTLSGTRFHSLETSGRSREGRVSSGRRRW